MRLSSRLFPAAVLAVAALGLTSSAQAKAPMVKIQAPGFYRFMVGSFEVTVVSDGTVKLPMNKLLSNTKPEKTSATLKRAFLADEVETSVNTYLVNTGTKLVLIDTGAAGLFGPTLGNLLPNLKAAGYQPEQIDEIYITHMHPDHVGGLIANGAIAFPNATLRIDKADVDFWLDEAKLKAAPEGAKGFFQGAMASVNPYVAAKKLVTFSGATELIPGVRAEPSHGHTVGHTSYVVESDGQKLVLWGDLMHAAAVQFADPGVTIQFDTDPKAAAAERKKDYADAAKKGYLVGITHVSFPGVGHLRAAAGGKGYEWLPLNYTGGK